MVGVNVGGSQEQARSAGLRFRHRPALDALRGLAVLLVVAFHADLGIARGGYLGVSTFFTLSGFLIVTLVLLEHERDGAFSARAFWGRRFRRLLPAAVATVVLVIVLVAWIGQPSARADVGADATASLAYVANWHLLGQGTSYADLFVAPNPLVHLWSLAIEEQFYVVLPLVVLALAAIGRRRHVAGDREDSVGRLRLQLGVLAAAAIVVSAGLPWLMSFDADRTYYGTDTRVAELAIGVLLAVMLYPGVSHDRRLAPGGRRVLTAMSVVALAAMAVAWASIGDSSLAWRRGGFAVYAVGSALLVAAAVHEVEPMRRLGRLLPLCQLGIISYAVYLFHWPVLWVIGQETTWPPLVRFVVTMAVSVGLATLSFRYFESPIRRTGRLGSRRVMPVVAAVALVAVVAGMVVTTLAPPPAIDIAAAQQDFADLPAMATPTPGAPVTPDAPAVPTVAQFGDSTALLAGLGMAKDLEGPDRQMHVVLGSSALGCGLLVSVAVSVRAPLWDTSPGHLESCAGWAEQWRTAIDSYDPDLVMVMLGVWEAVNLELRGVPGRHRLGEPVVDDLARSLLEEAIDIVTAKGGRAVLVTSPKIRHEWSGGNPSCNCDDGIKRWNELLWEAAAADPQRVSVLDLAGWLDSLDPAEQRRLRPDGLHFSPETGAEASRRWIVPQLLQLDRRESPGAGATAETAGADLRSAGG